MSVKTANADEQSDADLLRGDNSADSKMEKQQLKKQILKLRSLITRAEASLNITKFGDIKKSLSSPRVDPRASDKLTDPSVLFRKEIHRYAGFYCTKANKSEYVFNYKPYCKIGPKEIFWVQIHAANDKATLGKWVAPSMTIDVDRILLETPLDSLSTIVPFLKNWKLHIDCYTERKLRFQELKDSISDVSNCTVNVTASFTRITLELFGVYVKAKDSYVDLTVYLLYKPNETRPYKIITEWNLKKCSPEEKSELKAYTKCLKNHSISEGFRLMLETTNPVFSWTMQHHDDSPLELNDTSDSDEESFLEVIKRRKATKKRQKRRKSKERAKRTRGKKASVKSQPRVNNDVERTARDTSKLLLQLREINPSVSQSENTVDELAEKPRRKLRQTTISFQSNRTSNKTAVSEIHEVPGASPKNSLKLDKRKPEDKIGKKATVAKKQKSPTGISTAKRKGIRKTTRTITSTPLNRKIASRVNFVTISDAEISPIASADEKDNEK